MAAKLTHMKSARAKRANYCFSLLSTQIFTVVVVIVVVVPYGPYSFQEGTPVVST